MKRIGDNIEIAIKYEVDAKYVFTENDLEIYYTVTNGIIKAQFMVNDYIDEINEVNYLVGTIVDIVDDVYILEDVSLSYM